MTNITYPNSPVTIPPSTTTTRLSNCVSKCRISTAYTTLFTNGSINNHASFNVNSVNVDFDYILLYSSEMLKGRS
jgi:hypothetical protein